MRVRKFQSGTRTLLEALEPTTADSRIATYHLLLAVTFENPWSSGPEIAVPALKDGC